MGMGVFQQKEPKKLPGAHKIGAAISGPRIMGRKITDVRHFFSEERKNDQTRISSGELPLYCCGIAPHSTFLSMAHLQNESAIKASFFLKPTFKW